MMNHFDGCSSPVAQYLTGMCIVLVQRTRHILPARSDYLQKCRARILPRTAAAAPACNERIQRKCAPTKSANAPHVEANIHIRAGEGILMLTTSSNFKYHHLINVRVIGVQAPASLRAPKSNHSRLFQFSVAIFSGSVLHVMRCFGIHYYLYYKLKFLDLVR